MLGAMGATTSMPPRAAPSGLELFDGVPLIPALIGLFAISEAFVMIEQETIVSSKGRAGYRASWHDTLEVCAPAANWWHIVWTSLIGLVVGVLPGAGPASGFCRLSQSRFFSKSPEAYGKGYAKGVLAPEAANNGVTSGTLVPLLHRLASPAAARRR